MAKGSTRTARLSDNVSNPGPGLFIEPADISGVERAYEACRRFLSGRDGRAEINDEGLKSDLMAIVRLYRSDRDYDLRMTHAEMKSELMLVRSLVKKMNKALDQTQPHSAHHLNIAIRNVLGAGPTLRDFMTEVKEALIILEKGCDSVAKRKNKKTKDVAVDRACAKLWPIWEKLSGQSFVRQWELAAGLAKHGRKDREFVKDDARFVQSVIQAIDPEVPVARIRTGLKRTAAARPAKKSK